MKKNKVEILTERMTTAVLVMIAVALPVWWIATAVERNARNIIPEAFELGQAHAVSPLWCLTGSYARFDVNEFHPELLDPGDYLETGTEAAIAATANYRLDPLRAIAFGLACASDDENDRFSQVYEDGEARYFFDSRFSPSAIVYSEQEGALYWFAEF